MYKSQRMIAAIAACMLVTGPLGAETSRLQPDFSFNRVTVPKTNSSRQRITVQIAPAAPQAPSAPATARSAGTGAETPAAPRVSGLEWFWAGVSPDISDTEPGRLELALREIANAPEGKAVPIPRLQDLQAVAN